MLEKLRQLKTNYEANMLDIIELESSLDRFAEGELASELEKFALFDHINQEK